jgi:NitT/TauT family transport system substrate-binding protein
VLCLYVAALLLYVLPAVEAQPSEPARIVIADSRQPVIGLLYVAQNLGYFRDEKLDIAYQRYETGREGVAAIAAKGADVAFATETPIVAYTAKGTDLVILATVGTTERNFGIVATLASGIKSAKDLSSKSVGMTFGTNAEFFLDRFLVFSGVSPGKVKRVNYTPPQLVEAVSQGKVDAGVFWQPYLGRAIKAAEGRPAVFAPRNLYSWAFHLTTTREYATSHEQEMTRLLRAIVRAERHCQSQMPACVELISKELAMPAVEMKVMAEDMKLGVSLDQSLLFAIEDQVRWMKRRGENISDRASQSLEYLFTAPLRFVQPDAVQVVETERPA